MVRGFPKTLQLQSPVQESLRLRKEYCACIEICEWLSGMTVHNLRWLYQHYSTMLSNHFLQEEYQWSPISTSQCASPQA